MDIPKSKGINIRNELIQFHKKWYSSHLMNLVLIGRGNLISDRGGQFYLRYSSIPMGFSQNLWMNSRK